MSKEKDFLDKAGLNGYTPFLDGGWIVWKPVLPIELMMESMNLDPNKLAKLIEEKG